jgi:hypothetical protein
MNKNKNAKVSSIKFDSFYVLTMGINGVHAKFIGAPWIGSKKKVIRCQRAWLPTSKDPSKCRYLKRINLLL